MRLGYRGVHMLRPRKRILYYVLVETDKRLGEYGAVAIPVEDFMNNNAGNWLGIINRYGGRAELHVQKSLLKDFHGCLGYRPENHAQTMGLHWGISKERVDSVVVLKYPCACIYKENIEEHFFQRVHRALNGLKET